MAKQQRNNNSLDMDGVETTDGAGPGGRVLVDTGKGPRAPMQGDQIRPRCPKCSTEAVAVLCVVGTSNPDISYYHCPNKCGYTERRLRPNVANLLLGKRPTPTEPFASRPDLEG